MPRNCPAFVATTGAAAGFCVRTPGVKSTMTADAAASRVDRCIMGAILEHLSAGRRRFVKPCIYY